MSIIEIGLTEKVYPDMLNAVPYYILKYQLLRQTGLMLKSILRICFRSLLERAFCYLILDNKQASPVSARLAFSYWKQFI